MKPAITLTENKIGYIAGWLRVSKKAWKEVIHPGMSKYNHPYKTKNWIKRVKK